jgi:hypothetical protein
VPAVRLLLDFLGERMAQTCNEEKNGSAVPSGVVPGVAPRPGAA